MLMQRGVKSNPCNSALAAHAQCCLFKGNHSRVIESEKHQPHPPEPCQYSWGLILSMVQYPSLNTLEPPGPSPDS